MAESNLVSSRQTLKDEVTAGSLTWESGEPGEISADPADMITRSDYEAWVENVDMSGSAIEPNQLMSVGKMQQYKATGLDTPPYNFNVSIVNSRPTGETHLDCSWSNGDATAQTILNFYVGGSLSKSVTVAAGVTSVRVDGLSPDTGYTVYAYHEKSGLNSASVSDTARTLVDGPDAGTSGAALSSITDRPLGETHLNFSWSSGDSTAQTRIRIRVAGGSWGGWIYQSPGDTFYRFSQLSPDTQYEAEAEHVKNGVTYGGRVSDTASTLVDGPDVDPHSLSAAITNTTANISWTNGDGSAQVQVYRNLNGSGYTWLKTLSPGVTSTNDSLGDGDNASYRVRHIKNGVTSGWSNSDSVGVDGPNAAPSGMSVTGRNGDFAVSWTNGDSSAHTALYRSINDGSYSRVTLLSPGVSSYVDDGYGENVKGEYFARHEKNGLTTGNSNVGTGYTYDYVNAAPYSLNETNVDTDSATLRWTNGESVDSNWLYYRRAGASSWNRLHLSGSATNYTIGGLSHSTQYQWFVRAEKTDRGGNTWSKDSSTASFSTDLPTAPPVSNLVITGKNGGVISVSFSSSSSFNTRLELWEGSTKRETFLHGVNTSEYQFDTQVNPNTSFSVRAYHYASGYNDSQATIISSSTPDGPNGVPYDGGSVYVSADDMIDWVIADQDSSASVEAYVDRPDGSRYPAGSTLTFSPTTHSWWFTELVGEGSYTFNARYVKNGYTGAWTSWSVLVGPGNEVPTFDVVDSSYMDINGFWHYQVRVYTNWNDDGEDCEIWGREGSVASFSRWSVRTTPGQYYDRPANPGSTYDVRVRLAKDGHLGNWSTTKSVQIQSNVGDPTDPGDGRM